MKLGSLFDGSGTCPLAARMCGVEPVWASEIEPYPIRVTKKNFPGMRHLGDIKQIDGAKIEPVDVITFGSPCQDLSTAGKQTGLIDGERSSLFFEAIRIIREMREATDGKYPRYAVWENVPGAFGSNRGRDFLAVLRAFAGVAGDGDDVPAPEGKGDRLGWSKSGCIMGDGYSIAWRQLDAQYWGVPQRRKRIYLVADFAGQCAGKILFEREGLRGDFAQGAGERERAAADAAGSAGGSGDAERLIYCMQGNGIDRAETAGCNGRGWREDVCYTLNTIDRPAICFKPGQGAKARTIGESEKTVPTLASEAGGNSVPSVCYPQVARTLTAEADASFCIDRGQNVVCYDARGNGDGTHCPTLTRNHEQPISAYGGRPPRKYIIRRLTPLECCRLQGFPDDWTDGIDGSDTAKYKMWGNGMALPCVLYVMQGITEEKNENEKSN